MEDHGHSHEHGHSHGHGHGHEDLEEDNDEDAMEDKKHFEDVVESFRRYKDHSLVPLERLTRDFYALSKLHQAILKDQPGKFAAMRQAVDANAAFLNAVIGEVDIFSNQQGNGALGSHEEKRVPSAESMDKVHSTLRQFVRDWADEGEAERQRCYKPILEVPFGCGSVVRHYNCKKEVERRFPLSLEKGEVNRYRVLVPGCGLGRLLWEFAQRGYAAQGNEFSYHMLLASNWVLNRSGGQLTAGLYPYALGGCNRVRIADQFQRIAVPNRDTSQLAPDVDLSMNAGEFCIVYGDEKHRESVDVVACAFFIDTAHNVVEYMEVMWNVLKEGGVWINLGPLLWHYTDQQEEVQIELTLEEVLYAAKEVGFEVEVLPPVSCTYAADRLAMMHTVYNCAFFVCKKVKK